MPRAPAVSSIPVATRSEQLEPVACSSHPDFAPRGAVRKVGPRPGQTRSARTDEPGGPASRPGDRELKLCNSPPGGASTTGGVQEKNGGISSDFSWSVCETAVAAERLDGRLCFCPSPLFNSFRLLGRRETGDGRREIGRIIRDLECEHDSLRSPVSRLPSPARGFAGPLAEADREF